MAKTNAKVLVINAGSSSLKYQLFDMKNEKVLAKGNCEKIGIKGSFVSYKTDKVKEEFKGDIKDHTEALKKVIALLTDSKIGVIKGLNEITAVGHRVVQGGWLFDESCLVNKTVLKKLEQLKDLSPVHSAANLAGINGCLEIMPKTPQVLVFDTSFHRTMPEKAYTYGIKYQDSEKYHIRRYGFHGTSHRFVLGEVAKLLKKPVSKVNVITCHLGNGSSITAIEKGKSIDTTMGLTPLEGVIMGTRSGDIDASVVSYLCDQKGMTAQQVFSYLNKESGILGVSGVSSDLRDINDAIKKGNKRARLALDMLIYRVKKYIGAYMAVLGKVDAIVFTGGVGENQEDLREEALKGLENFGIEIDVKKNKTLPRGTIEEISKPQSKVKVFRIPTDEELLIARDTVALISKEK